MDAGLPTCTGRKSRLRLDMVAYAFAGPHTIAYAYAGPHTIAYAYAGPHTIP